MPDPVLPPDLGDVRKRQRWREENPEHEADPAAIEEEHQEEGVRKEGEANHDLDGAREGALPEPDNTQDEHQRSADRERGHVCKQDAGRQQHP